MKDLRFVKGLMSEIKDQGPKVKNQISNLHRSEIKRKKLNSQVRGQKVKMRDSRFVRDLRSSIEDQYPKVKDQISDLDRSKIRG